MLENAEYAAERPLVLDDCRSGVPGTQGRVARYLATAWLITITLLRAVGHVLAKADSGSSDAGIAIDKQFAELKARKPEPVIFWRFIEEERNNVLKVYRFAVEEISRLAYRRAPSARSPIRSGLDASLNHGSTSCWSKMDRSPGDTRSQSWRRRSTSGVRTGRHRARSCADQVVTAPAGWGQSVLGSRCRAKLSPLACRRVVVPGSSR